MIHDLRSILDGWDYEPGKISVRKIIGRDGREKIQTRVDLGLLQCEVEGRPDGARPHGHPSLLDYFEAQLREHIRAHGADTGFSLSEEDCENLRVEGRLYYQRYLALFVLEEFDGVERDSARNLRLIEFCSRYAHEDHDREALESQRAYVYMMNVRGRVYHALQQRKWDEALDLVEQGLRELRELTVDSEALVPYEVEESSEMRVLLDLRSEVLQRVPANSPRRLEWELQEALANEQYELAAILRDRIARAARKR